MIIKLLLGAVLVSTVSVAEFIKLDTNKTESVDSKKAGTIQWKKSYHAGLAAAQSEEKPYLFIISRHTCRYCVQLEETALSDAEVIQTLNDNFITHTAYTDDGDYYPQALWAGGTPMIWFLMPTGEPMFQPIPGAIPTEAFREALAVVLTEFDARKKAATVSKK